jgi:hypothetical protein
MRPLSFYVKYIIAAGERNPLYAPTLSPAQISKHAAQQTVASQCHALGNYSEGLVARSENA